MADSTLKFLLVGEDKSASKSLRDVGDEADKTKGKLGGMGEVFGGAMLADLASQAADAIIDFGGDSVAAFRDAEASQRKLEDAYARFPALADTNIQSLRDLNSAIQAKTGADADDLASSQASLAQYGLTGQQIADLTPLLDDYAVKTGKDLPSAAEDLGKAMLGQGKALKGIGIDFKDAGSVGANFDQVMGGLRTQVGGFATSEASTAEGAVRKLNTEFGDVQESVGQQLLPVLTGLGQALLGVIGFVKENSSVLLPLGAAVGVVVGAITAWSAIQAVLNVVLAANPLGIIIVAIAALVAGLIIAYNTSAEFRAVVDTAFKAIGEAGAWLWNNALAPVVRFIVNGFAAIVEGIAGMLRALGNIPGFGWATDAANAMDAAAGKARSLAQGIQDIPTSKTVTVTTNFVVTGQVAAAASANNIARITAGYASGGRPEVGQIAMFGEAGPELWVPDAAGTVLDARKTASLMRGPTPVAGIGEQDSGGVDIAAAVREGMSGAQIKITGGDVLMGVFSAELALATQRRAGVR